MQRKHYINSPISADERMQLNEEVDLIYGGITKNAINHSNLVNDFNSFLGRYGIDKTNLEKMIRDGDTNVLNIVERMILDFLTANPSDFDEVVAARLGKTTLRDLTLEFKNRLDGTEVFQKSKITDDTGRGFDIANATNPFDLYKLFDEPFAIRRFYKGVINAPTSTNTGFVMNFSLYNASGTSTLVCFDWTNRKVWLNHKNDSVIDGWKALAWEGAYDDIKQEVLNIKGDHPSLDVAIRAMIPYNSVKYYGNDNAAFQKALNESAGKTLDIPAGTYTIGDLEIPSNINVRSDPNAVFTLKAGSTTFFTNKDTVNIGGYDKTRDIIFKGGVFDLKKLKDAKVFVLSHCQDVKVDTKVCNGGESQAYVALNAVKDSEIDIEAIDCNATTAVGAVVGIYVFNDKNTLTSQNAKPYDLTACDNVTVNLKLKNVKKGLTEITPIDKVIHKSINYNVQAENVLEELGLFNNVSYFKTEKCIGNDIGHGLVFQIQNDSCEDFTIEGVNIRNGKNKETSRGVWFKSKEGDTAPQYKNIRVINPVVKGFNKGITTDYGVGAKIINPDVQECWEDGIWNYFTLDWAIHGGMLKYNNKVGWPSRADLHIGEISIAGGNKKTFRSIVSDVQARTIRAENLQDSRISAICKGGSFVKDGSDYNNKFDVLEVGW
ncbi:hypothetical protein QUF99_19185 [Bacillus sp. DX4.1]|uniref:hypothetical protein n=1 Tax=Bacillus sp. DX4.1 TaxID=3055867 RepID=UPI0025A2701E|nr:hypothetical protein [Bacillus sp. DX4.1]MDM5189351.1 hypothetical protein [Bacillus sp. DX4.1]